MEEGEIEWEEFESEMEEGAEQESGSQEDEDGDSDGEPPKLVPIKEKETDDRKKSQAKNAAGALVKGKKKGKVVADKSQAEEEDGDGAQDEEV